MAFNALWRQRDSESNSSAQALKEDLSSSFIPAMRQELNTAALIAL